MLCWEWPNENYIMLKFFQVITYHPIVNSEFENNIIVISEYQIMYFVQ